MTSLRIDKIKTNMGAIGLLAVCSDCGSLRFPNFIQGKALCPDCGESRDIPIVENDNEGILAKDIGRDSTIEKTITESA